MQTVGGRSITTAAPGIAVTYAAGFAAMRSACAFAREIIDKYSGITEGYADLPAFVFLRSMNDEIDRERRLREEMSLTLRLLITRTLIVSGRLSDTTVLGSARETLSEAAQQRLLHIKHTDRTAYEHLSELRTVIENEMFLSEAVRTTERVVDGHKDIFTYVDVSVLEKRVAERSGGDNDTLRAFPMLFGRASASLSVPVGYRDTDGELYALPGITSYRTATQLIFREHSTVTAPGTAAPAVSREASAAGITGKTGESYGDTERLIFRTESASEAENAAQSSGEGKVSTVETVEKSTEHYNDTERLIYRTESASEAETAVQNAEVREVSMVETVEKPAEHYNDTERLIYRTESASEAENPAQGTEARKVSTVETVEKSAEHYNDTERLVYRTEIASEAETAAQSAEARKISTVETVEKPIEHYNETERLIYRTEGAHVAEATTQSAEARKVSTVETVEKPTEHYNETERLKYRTESTHEAEATTQSAEARKVPTVETVEKPAEHYSETERLIYRTESANDAETAAQSAEIRIAPTVETVEKPTEHYSETERLIYRTESARDAETALQSTEMRKVPTAETVEKPTEHYNETEKLIYRTESAPEAGNAGKITERYSETERSIYRTESAHDAETPLKSAEARKTPEAGNVEKTTERYGETERLIYRTERESSSETRDIGLLAMNSYFGEGARYLSQTAERHIHRSFTLAPTLRETLVLAESRSDTFTSLTKAVQLLTSEKTPSAHERKLTERAVELVLRREGEKPVTVREFRELDRERRTQVLAELTRLIAADAKKGKHGRRQAPRGISENEAALLTALTADKAGEAVKMLAGADTVLLRQLSRIYEAAPHTEASRIYNVNTTNAIYAAEAPETGYTGNTAAMVYRTVTEKAAGHGAERELQEAPAYRVSGDRIYERAVRLYERVLTRSPEAFAQLAGVPAAGDIRVTNIHAGRRNTVTPRYERNVTNIYTGTERADAKGRTYENAAAPQYDTATLTERPQMPRMYPGSASDGGDIRLTAGPGIRKLTNITNRYDIRRSSDTMNTFMTLRGADMTNNTAQSAPAAEAQPLADIHYLPVRREAPERGAPAQPAAVSAEELVSRFGNLIEGADAGLSQAGIVHVSGDISRGVREAVAKVAVTEEKVAENSKLISDIRRRQTEMEEQVLRRSDIDELSESFIGKLRSQLRYEKSRYS